MSTDTEPRIPGPDHPITIERFDGRVAVSRGDVQIADTSAALELREASYPPAYYVPLADVDRDVLRQTDTHTHCPYKGDASYYDVVNASGDTVAGDAVWHYTEPYPLFTKLADYVAFYPDRVQLEVQPAGAGAA